MVITLCDRCHRKTVNGGAFLQAVDRSSAVTQVGGVWFGNSTILCNDCLTEFEEWLTAYQENVTEGDHPPVFYNIDIDVESAKSTSTEETTTEENNG